MTNPKSATASFVNIQDLRGGKAIPFQGRELKNPQRGLIVGLPYK